jgi:hypothetical protein
MSPRQAAARNQRSSPARGIPVRREPIKASVGPCRLIEADDARGIGLIQRSRPLDLPNTPLDRASVRTEEECVRRAHRTEHNAQHPDLADPGNTPPHSRALPAPVLSGPVDNEVGREIPSAASERLTRFTEEVASLERREMRSSFPIRDQLLTLKRPFWHIPPPNRQKRPYLLTKGRKYVKFGVLTHNPPHWRAIPC